ncbi:hypothetical protein NYO67_4705 [Aspergillus flavus]|nr:hypothetical protein NYO67_4705 [Aspergillus flavus]
MPAHRRLYGGMLQHPNLKGWDPPAFYDTDGAAVYEGESCELLYDIPRRDDVAALQQYHRQCTKPIILRDYGYDWDNPFAYAIEHHSFRTYLARVDISLMHDMCAAADLELFQWLLQREPPLASLSGQDFQGRTALFSAAVGLGDVENEEEETEEEQARRVLTPRNKCILASAGEASSDRASTIWVSYTTRVTPLHIARLFWNADAIRVLLDHCGRVDRTAMVNAMDSKGRLSLHWALTRSQGIPRDWPFGDSDPTGRGRPGRRESSPPRGPSPREPSDREQPLDQPLDLDLIDRVLEQVRVNDPAPVDGSTALHYLVHHWDQLDLLRYLVQCGATVNATNYRGKTPLHDVMRGGLFVFDRRGCWRKLEPVDWDRSIQARDAMLGVLIEAGGCMEQRNCAGDTPTQVWDQVTERQRRRLQQRDVARQLLARGRGAGIIGGRDNNLL